MDKKELIKLIYHSGVSLKGDKILFKDKAYQMCYKKMLIFVGSNQRETIHG